MTVEKDNWRISGPAEIMGPWPRRLIKGDCVRFLGDERILTLTSTPGTQDEVVRMHCVAEGSHYHVNHRDMLEMVSRKGPEPATDHHFRYAGYGPGANAHGTLWLPSAGETSWTLDCHTPWVNDIVGIERLGWLGEIFDSGAPGVMGLRSIRDPETVMLLSPEVFNRIVWLERRQRR